MSFNDHIADMLTRVRNAANAGHDSVIIPHSKLKESIIKVICDEGFLDSVDVEGTGIRKSIIVKLKYIDGKPAFRDMSRVSRLGRRQYVSAKNIKPSRQGVGVSIISTSKGVMKDMDARRNGVGGEIVCSIW